MGWLWSWRSPPSDHDAALPRLNGPVRTIRRRFLLPPRRLMGRVPRLTTSALLAAAVVIGILDPHNAPTALVAAAIPTVVHAATKKTRHTAHLDRQRRLHSRHAHLRPPRRDARRRRHPHRCRLTNPRLTPHPPQKNYLSFFFV